MRVGFVGAGNMGGAMAANLLAAGHELAVCDARPEAVSALVALGARAAASPADAALGADLVSIAVMDSPQVEAVTNGPDGVFAGVESGAVIAVHSTVHPRTVQHMAEVAPHGIEVLDAPISGGVEGAREATLCIMVGGDSGAFDRARPAFEVMGNLVLHLGALGSGLAAKLARNLIGYITLVAAHEGRSLGAAAGVDDAALVAIACHTGALSPMMQSLMDGRGGASVYAANLDPLVALAEKDLDVTLEYVSDLGLDLPATRLTRASVAAALRGDLTA